MSTFVIVPANETFLTDEDFSGSGDEHPELIWEMTKADLDVEAYFNEAIANTTLQVEDNLPTHHTILNETKIKNECPSCVQCKPVENSGISIHALCFYIFLTNALTITVFTLSAVLVSYLSQPPDFY